MPHVLDLSPTTTQFSPSEIASLTAGDIDALHYDEMVAIVLASGLPVRSRDQLPMLEGDTIVRLVHMARDYCRGRES